LALAKTVHMKAMECFGLHGCGEVDGKSQRGGGCRSKIAEVAEVEEAMPGEFLFPHVVLVKEGEKLNN
jgi:hypothetical protein